MFCTKCGNYTEMNYGTTDIRGVFCSECWDKILQRRKR